MWGAVTWSNAPNEQLLHLHVMERVWNATDPEPGLAKAAKGIQSTRNAVWSLIITADASSRWNTRITVSWSLLKTAA